MCGIVGYTGDKQCQPILLGGLERLEYRGYDSAGVAIYDGGTINIAKAKGRLTKLQDRLLKTPLSGTTGIGHTRWATHGEPSDINAHPQSNAGHGIAVVHNGIIENYFKLKQMLSAKGYKFASETDTEVIAHLLDYYYNGDMVAAIYKTVAVLKGSYALAIICNDAPEKLYCVRKDSPLVVGLTENEGFIGSDVTALLEYTRNIYFLDDRDVAVIGRGTAEFYDEFGQRAQRPAQRISWDIEAAEKGGFEHFMIKEIHEQPSVLRNTLEKYVDTEAMAMRDEFMPIDAERAKRLSSIKIVACGTAYHAGMVGKAIIEKLARIPVEVDIASEYRYRDPIIDKGDLFIIISQSGETADTIAAMREAKRRGAEVIAICNMIGSTIAREADHVLYTIAGPEIAVASTKAFISQVLMLYILAYDMASKRGNIKSEELFAAISELKTLPEKTQALLERKDVIQYFASRVFDRRHMFYIGRGLDYCLALEAALKLKEISYVHAEAYAAGELKHGTIALIEEGVLVVAIATQGYLVDKIASNVKEVKVRGAEVLALVSENDDVMEQEADHIWRIPHTNRFSPILSIIPMQLFAYYMALERGCDIDKPRNLAKSVTVE
ncbi:MAG: glutamine--fructose-6-phosphate transaminase (isomerizing) [Christensenellales bacterium]|jgi:glucosamine--fructose-6-phosphate aminotransferase (isomerizing)